jgi:hypothetical protein
VNVSFSINTNGILEITGEVKDANISNQIVIKQNKVGGIEASGRRVKV